MIAHCGTCSARYRVPDEKIRTRGVRFRCSGCGARIVVRPEDSDLRTEDLSEIVPQNFGAAEVLPKGSIPPMSRRVVPPAPSLRPQPPLTPPMSHGSAAPTGYGAPGALHTQDAAPQRRSTPQQAPNAAPATPAPMSGHYTPPTAGQGRGPSLPRITYAHTYGAPGTGIPLDPRTGIPLDPRTGIPLDPRTGIPLDPRTGIPLDPRTGIPMDPRTGLPAPGRWSWVQPSPTMAWIVEPRMLGMTLAMVFIVGMLGSLMGVAAERLLFTDPVPPTAVPGTAPGLDIIVEPGDTP